MFVSKCQNQFAKGDGWDEMYDMADVSQATRQHSIFVLTSTGIYGTLFCMIYVCTDLQNAPEGAVQTLLARTPAWRCEAALQHHSAQEQLQSLVAFQLLCRALGTVPPQFTVGAYGKPLLDTAEFSLSHSRGAVAVGIASQPIGVDVELVRPHPAAVIKRYMTAAERRSIQDSEDSDRQFFLLWTLKESYVKAVGVGLRGLRQASFTFPGPRCADARFACHTQSFGVWQVSACGTKDDLSMQKVSIHTILTDG